MKRLLAAVMAASWLLGAAPVLAIQPDEVLADPVLEQRARDLGKQLRCLVCQNQSIDDSDADLARDLRIVVRERLVAGDTDAGVLDFMQARYGDFVLLKPPMRPGTYLLWFGPALLVLAGLAAVFFFFRRPRRKDDEAPLSPSERRRVQRLLDETASDGSP